MSVIHPTVGPIDGVAETPLRRIPDERGAIFHCVKQSELNYDLAEVYFKKLYPNTINGWHVHETMTLSYTTFLGCVKLVLCDLRQDSPTFRKLMVFYCGEDNYCRITIPPGVANASQSVVGPFSMFANTPDKEHDPKLKYERIDPFEGRIKYEWFQRHY